MKNTKTEPYYRPEQHRHDYNHIIKFYELFGVAEAAHHKQMREQELENYNQFVYEGGIDDVVADTD